MANFILEPGVRSGWTMLWAIPRGARAIACLMIASALAAAAGAAETPVAALDPWSNVTAGEEITLRFRMPPGTGSGDAVGWSVAVERAIIARRESEVRGDSDGRPVLTVKFRLPDGEPKTTVPVSVFISSANQDRLAKRLWIYPSDPFQHPVPHLADKPLVLFDPIGATAARWDELSMEFREQKNIDALAELKQGVLVIGEGVSFREYRGLPEVIRDAAQRGLKVLCLAPAAGTLGLSLDDEIERHKIVHLDLARADVLTRFDKHLDFLDWRGTSPVGDTTLQFISKSNQMSAEVGAAGRGWPWLEVEYAGGGRIVVSCFRCIGHWDAGPAPRHALWHILAHTARPIQTSGSDE